MSTATPLQPLSPNAVAAAQEPQTFLARLAQLPLSRKLMLAAGIVGLIAISLAMTSWSRDASYKVLFAGLSDKDGGAILAQLSQMNVPYKHAEGGSAILVPADKVHDVRLKLAQVGLPKGSTVGFELMDNARFGTTQFQERLNFQRGLEGELVRSITALSAVQAARVHLALPNQNGFFREQQKPSASVLLTLHNGRTLDRSQIAGIVHLVSSSVPELNPKSVSVLDHTGTLLSGPTEGMDEGPAIVQAAVPVLPDDTSDMLAARVLTVEHRSYPLALRLVAEGKVRMEGSKAVSTGDLPRLDGAQLISPAAV